MNNPNRNYDRNGLLPQNKQSPHIPEMPIHTTESVIRFACNRIS